MLNVLDDCDRRGARHPSRAHIRKLPMTRQPYLSGLTSWRLFVTDTSRVALSVSSYLGPPTNTIRIQSTPSSPLCASRRSLAGNSDSSMNCRSQTLTPSYLRSPFWPWPQEGRHTEIGGSVPESKRRLGRQPLSVKANVGTLREVVTLVSVAWVLVMSRFGYGEEIL